MPACLLAQTELIIKMESAQLALKVVDPVIITDFVLNAQANYY